MKNKSAKSAFILTGQDENMTEPQIQEFMRNVSDGQLTRVRRVQLGEELSLYVFTRTFWAWLRVIFKCK